jgi:Eukaryotic aspartyl protease.
MGENSTIEFKFGKLEFQFYLSQFVSQQSDIATNDGWYSDEETCYFTICENVHLQYEGSIVLGSNFMSTVYAVFDLENDEISLANLNWWEHNPDDIVEITSGKNGVPGAKSGASESKSGTSGAENGTPGATKASAGTHIEKGLGMMAVLVGAVVMLNL